MNIKELENAIKQIKESVNILENSKYEKIKKLDFAGRQIRLNLSKEDLMGIFHIDNLESVEKFGKSNKFSNNVKMIEFDGGFVILKND